MSAVSRIGLAIGLAGMAVGLAGCDPSSPPDTDPRLQPPLVRFAKAQEAGETERGFTGLVVARVQSNLTFRVAGKVTVRLVDAGQQVRAGQPLMRIDRTDYEHAIAVQKGNAAAARARMKQAVADALRFQALVTSGAVSQSAYDQAKAAADSARALSDAAEAQLKVAQNEGQYATLVADADGVIMETLAEPGQFVAAGQVVMRLAQDGPREAAIDLPETLRPAIGAEAEASLYGVDGHFPARLRQLSDTADPVTRTFEARYVLDGRAAAAPLGATVSLRVAASGVSSGIRVPLGALDDRGSGPGVWIVDGASATVSFRPVTVRGLESEGAILSDGVRSGEAVVALGGHILQEGQKVRAAEQYAGLK